jgi:hypothetical protein
MQAINRRRSALLNVNTVIPSYDVVRLNDESGGLCHGRFSIFKTTPANTPTSKAGT